MDGKISQNVNQDKKCISEATPATLLTLIFLSAAQLMIALDVSIVNVALPTIQLQLHFTTTGLQWIISAYALTFGGLLLIGGRISDYLGRKRTFIYGLIIFAASSMLGGLSPSPSFLIAARATQGIGAAILAPSALSLISTICEEGPERNRAFGIFSAMAVIGFVIGLLLGGILTTYLSWRWIFFVNVPIAITIIIYAILKITPQLKAPIVNLDLKGAITITVAMVILVSGISLLAIPGTSFLLGLVLITIAILMGLVFIFIERHTDYPIIPLNIFLKPLLVAANAVRFLIFGSFIIMLFTMTLYLQDLQGYSAIDTGLIFGIAGVGGLISAWLAPKIVNRLGVRSTIIYFTLLFAIAIIPLTFLNIHSSLWLVIISFIVVPFGATTCVVASTVGGTTGIKSEMQGLAAGLLNASQQIGAAIGVSTASVVEFTVRLNGGGGPIATLEGYKIAFILTIALSIIAVIIAWLLIPSDQ